jgi:hypothetical protein
MGIEEVSNHELGTETHAAKARWTEALDEGKTFGASLSEALDRADKWSSGAWEPVPVPLNEWGAILGGDVNKPGIYPGLHVIAAGTSVGKTALATSIATMAATAGGLVAYFALELSAGQVALRMASELKGFGHWATVARGRGGDRQGLESVAAKLTDSGIWVYEPKPATDLPIFEWAEAIRGLSDANGTKTTPVLILDYVQLVGLGGSDLEARARLSKAAGDLRRAARECDVAVVAISSVARASYAITGPGGWDTAGCEASGNVTNPHAMLVAKESGEIEFFADSQTTIITMRRTETELTCALIVAKNREGKLGWAPGLFREGKWTDDATRAEVAAFAPKKKAEPGKDNASGIYAGVDISGLLANAEAKKNGPPVEADRSEGKARQEAQSLLSRVFGAWYVGDCLLVEGVAVAGLAEYFKERTKLPGAGKRSLSKLKKDARADLVALVASGEIEVTEDSEEWLGDGEIRFVGEASKTRVKEHFGDQQVKAAMDAPDE